MKTGQRKLGAARREMRVYEVLGIRQFRKILFGLERLRHRRDGGKNVNYHLGSVHPGSAEAFSGYLLYHTLLHSVAILLLVVPFLLLREINASLFWADGFLILLFLLNVWCLMLQRYTCLRLRRLSALEAQRLKQHAKQEAEVCETGHLAANDLAFAGKMRKKLLAGESVILGAQDRPVLLRLAACFPAGEESSCGDGLPEKTDMLSLAENALRLPGKTETLVSRLQRRFTPNRKPVRHRCAVITEDGETDRAFRRLFCDPAPERILLRLMALGILEERQ